MPIRIPAATNTEFTGTPVGLYVCEVTGIDEWISETPSIYGNDSPQAKWLFTIRQIIDSDADEPDMLIGQDIWGFSTVSMGRKAKMRQWVEQILGRSILEDEEIEDDDLIGRRCKVSIVKHTRQDGTETTKIGAVQTYRAKTKAAAKPVQEPEFDDDEGSDDPF